MDMRVMRNVREDAEPWRAQVDAQLDALHTEARALYAQARATERLLRGIALGLGLSALLWFGLYAWWQMPW
ncbi:MAG TPA: hypothetical protein VNK41_01075 [Vicinamibacterales bacterium]|nr:hypothetical protein [Vicinamibacterales bacterium]